MKQGRTAHRHIPALMRNIPPPKQFRNTRRPLRDGGQSSVKKLPAKPPPCDLSGRKAGKLPDEPPGEARRPETDSPAKPENPMTKRQDYSRFRKVPLSLYLHPLLILFCHSCHKLKNLNNKYIVESK
jgi:hypothetical protein